jgi:hypothetical protein
MNNILINLENKKKQQKILFSKQYSANFFQPGGGAVCPDYSIFYSGLATK